MTGNDAFDQLKYKGPIYLVDIITTDKMSYVICPLDGRKRNYHTYCHNNCLGYTGGTNTKYKPGDCNCVRCKYPPKNGEQINWIKEKC